MPRRRKVYEGKAKILYEGPEPGTLVQYFKDDATAFNNQKKGLITGKGVLNNRISEYIMLHLADIGIPTHFVRRLNMREQLIREVEIIPVEVIVRNVAAGSISKRLGIAEGTPLPRSIPCRPLAARLPHTPVLQDAPLGSTVPGYATITRTLRLGGQDYRIRSLTDRQQFADPGHQAERLGISSAQWSLFGQVCSRTCPFFCMSSSWRCSGPERMTSTRHRSRL